jgi:hypothetical protein
MRRKGIHTMQLTAQFIAILILAVAAAHAADNQPTTAPSTQATTQPASRALRIGWSGVIRDGKIVWDDKDNPVGDAGLKFTAVETVLPPSETGVKELRPCLTLEGRTEVLILLDCDATTAKVEGRVLLVEREDLYKHIRQD